MTFMRNFIREETNVTCALVINNVVCKATMLNFSRMGAMIKTDCMLSKKNYVSLIYPNEKNEMIMMLTYVVHTFKKGQKYLIGLQFIGIEDRRSIN